MGINPLLSQRDVFLCGTHSFSLREKTYLMGILNVTTDSFSGDGLLKESDFSTAPEKALHWARQMVRSGADIIDIGGQSSRPGAAAVSQQEEMDRVIPAVRLLCQELTVPISIDTSRASVAEEALKQGVSLVNDIAGLTGDDRMASVIASYRASVVIMHMQGTPETMQKAPGYRDLIREIYEFFQSSIEKAKTAGIQDNRILLDPGIGFGKTVEHNLEILGSLERFTELGYPILIGTSRKSFIGKILDDRPVGDRLWGTAATVALAISKGANIVRVHDVGPMKDVIRVSDAILKERMNKHIG
ncbi:MAG: dihydropteroate synthase [Candidatus Omnitrophica bacterium]|nr:dihydropteroate synthase [Candidatus Omnitrophota bacterium]